MPITYVQFGIGNKPVVYDRNAWCHVAGSWIEDTETYTMQGDKILMVKSFTACGHNFNHMHEKILGTLESRYVCIDTNAEIYSDDLADIRSPEDLERVVNMVIRGQRSVTDSCERIKEPAAVSSDDTYVAKTSITGDNLFGWVIRLDVDPVTYKVALDKRTLSVYPIHTNGVHVVISNLSIEESPAANIDDIVPLTIEDYNAIKYGIMFMIMSKHTHLISSVNCKMVIPGITKENYTEWSDKFRRAIYRNRLSDVLPEGMPYALYDKVLFT